MKKLLLILTSLLLLAVVGCGTGDSVLGPTTDNQIQTNEYDGSGDKTDLPSDLTTGDPWDDEEHTPVGGGGGHTEEPGHGEDPEDPDGKDPDVVPHDPTGDE